MGTTTLDDLLADKLAERLVPMIVQPIIDALEENKKNRKLISKAEYARRIGKSVPTINKRIADGILVPDKEIETPKGVRLYFQEP